VNIDWKPLQLRKGDSLDVAVKLLEEHSLIGISLVTDDEDRLLGTITDGDIRRAIISKISLSDPVGSIMNRNPLTGRQEDSWKAVETMMRSGNVVQLPILDRNGKIVALRHLDPSVHATTNETPVLLMAGGFGRRLLPLTEETPKPMLEVGEKPILQTILERFLEEGFRKFFLSVHYLSSQIQDHFGDGSRWDVEIEYLVEKEPLGTAGALSLLPDTMGEAPLITMNSDLLTDVSFRKLLDYHLEQGGPATVCVREYDLQVPFGVVHPVENTVSQIIEKPVERFLVNAGIYVLEPTVYRKVKRDSPIDMPDLLREEITAGGKIAIFPVHEYWLDIGKIEEFESAKEEVEKEKRRLTDKRRFAVYDAVVIAGLMILVLALSADLIGLGGPGDLLFGPHQILGGATGLFVSIVGLLMKRALR